MEETPDGTARPSLGPGHHAPDDQLVGAVVSLPFPQLRIQHHRLHHHRTSRDDTANGPSDPPDEKTAILAATHEGDPRQVQEQERCG